MSERIVRPANVTNLVNKNTEGFLETAMALKKSKSNYGVRLHKLGALHIRRCNMVKQSKD